MKNAPMLMLASTALWLVAFYPMIYLMGILISFIPTYTYIFKKAIERVEEGEGTTLLSTIRREGEGIALYMLRRFVIPIVWLVICTFMWWALLVISMSKEKTELFIDGFSSGLEDNGEDEDE